MPAFILASVIPLTPNIGIIIWEAKCLSDYTQMQNRNELCIEAGKSWLRI